MVGDPVELRPEASSVAAPPEKQFHGWRLLGYLMIVIVMTAAVCALVDYIVVPR